MTSQGSACTASNIIAPSSPSPHLQIICGAGVTSTCPVYSFSPAVSVGGKLGKVAFPG